MKRLLFILLFSNYLFSNNISWNEKLKEECKYLTTKDYQIGTYQDIEVYSFLAGAAIGSAQSIGYSLPLGYTGILWSGCLTALKKNSQNMQKDIIQKMIDTMISIQKKS